MEFIESMKARVLKSFFWRFTAGNIYLVLFSLLVFITPLVMVRGANELYEFPKMFFVYFFGSFIMAFFFTDIVLHPVKLKKPSLLVVLFISVTAISTVVSSNLYTSFFGYYSRFNDGLLSYLVFFGLCFVAINKLKKGDFVKLFKISILTFVPIAAVGLAQHFWTGAMWPYTTVERVFSTFGQPNWLAQYLAVMLTICVYFALAEKLNRFYIWVVLYFFGFYCFWLTYSLSGLLAIAVGFFSLFLFFLGKERFSKDTLVKLFVLWTLSLCIIFANPGIFNGRVNDAIFDLKRADILFQKAYAAGEDYKISDPGFIRMGLWDSTYKLITSSPKIFFLGTGPETFPYVYQPFRSERLNYSSEWDFVFNKPHDYYLEIWSESGLFALVLYVALVLKTAFNSHYFVFPAIMAFAVSNIFGWPVVVTAMLFWLFVSYSEV